MLVRHGDDAAGEGREAEEADGGDDGGAFLGEEGPGEVQVGGDGVVQGGGNGVTYADADEVEVFLRGAGSFAGRGLLFLLEVVDGTHLDLVWNTLERA